MNRHQRKILQMNDNVIVKEWNSIKEANDSISDKNNCKQIRFCCKDISKKYGGFNWQYKTDHIVGENWAKHPTLDMECSSMGRIRNKTGRISTGGLNGCKATYLRYHCGKKWYLVHRLIAETFILNHQNKPTVDHIDRNRQNNKLGNLRWYDYVEQQSNRSDRI